MMLGSLITTVGIPLMLVVFAALKCRQDEREWFKEIFLANDRELSMRQDSDLKRDYRRMLDIEMSDRRWKPVGDILAGHARVALGRALEARARAARDT